MSVCSYARSRAAPKSSAARQVLNIEKDGGTGWIVNSVHTNAALRKRDGQVLKIRARKVVLAAGTLGSSEILLRSRDLGLQLSEAQLGKRCSTNGDMLVAITRPPLLSIQLRTKPCSLRLARLVRPSRGVIDLRTTAGVVIEEMSVPAGLRIAFTEIFATVKHVARHRRAGLLATQAGIPDR